MALSASISSKHFSWIELFTFRCSSASKDVRFIYINSVTATLMRFQSTHSTVIQQQRAVAVALSFTVSLKLLRELQWAYCITWKHRVWFDWRSFRFRVLWKGTKLHGWNWYVEHRMHNIELDIYHSIWNSNDSLRSKASSKLQSIVQWRSESAREDPDLLFEWVSIRISNGNSMHISCVSSQERKSHGIQASEESRSSQLEHRGVFECLVWYLTGSELFRVVENFNKPNFGVYIEMEHRKFN